MHCHKKNLIGRGGGGVSESAQILTQTIDYCVPAGTCLRHWSTCWLSSSVDPEIFSLQTGHRISETRFLPFPRAEKRNQSYLFNLFV